MVLVMMIYQLIVLKLMEELPIPRKDFITSGGDVGIGTTNPVLGRLWVERYWHLCLLLTRL